jgi:hypothetical protein
MLCCFESPFSDAKSAYKEQVSTDVVSSYPGQRRIISKATAPQSQCVSSKNINATTLATQDQHNADVLISVTVPEGVLPGQEIHVKRPGGSGGLIEAIVPSGMKAGSTFYVRAPLEDNHFSDDVRPMPAPLNDAPAPLTPSADFSQCLDTPQHDKEETGQNSCRVEGQQVASPPKVPQPPPGQKLLRVHVTPQMDAGSALLVQIPDEPGRLVSAQVPPNVTEFFVAYTPRQSTTANTRTKHPKRRKDDVAGGLATGLMAAMLYGHYAH